MKNTEPRSQSNTGSNDDTCAALQEALADPGSDEEVGETRVDKSHDFLEENDWDEYEDEIASARALNAWLEALPDEPGRDEDDVGRT